MEEMEEMEECEENSEDDHEVLDYSENETEEE